MRTVIESVALGIVLALVSFLPLSAQTMPNFSEGMWEMKGEVKFEGAMKINGKTIPLKSMPLHYKKCLTKKDMVPQKEEKNQKCTKNVKVSGNSLTWTMKCAQPDKVVIESTGSGVFSKTSFDAKGRSVMTDAQGEKSRATMSMKGHRIGSCN